MIAEMDPAEVMVFVLLYLAAIALPLLIAWAIIKSAVLSALRQHEKERSRPLETLSASQKTLWAKLPKALRSTPAPNQPRPPASASETSHSPNPAELCSAAAVKLPSVDDYAITPSIAADDLVRLKKAEWAERQRRADEHAAVLAAGAANPRKPIRP